VVLFKWAHGSFGAKALAAVRLGVWEAIKLRSGDFSLSLILASLDEVTF